MQHLAQVFDCLVEVVDALDYDVIVGYVQQVLGLVELGIQVLQIGDQLCPVFAFEAQHPVL